LKDIRGVCVWGASSFINIIIAPYNIYIYKYLKKKEKYIKRKKKVNGEGFVCFLVLSVFFGLRGLSVWAFYGVSWY